MKALVYHGPGQRGWDTVDDPTIIDRTDIVVRIDSSTICGTDLHIALADTMAAYDTFADAATTKALKVVLEGTSRDPRFDSRPAAALVAGAA